MLCITNACSDDVVTSEKESVKGILKLTLEAGHDITARSINTAADDSIYDCTILTFNSSGKISGKGYQAVEKGVLKFDMQIGLSTNRGETCTVYAIANTNNPTLFDGIQTETEFKDIIVSFSTPENYAAGNISIGSVAVSNNGQLMVSDGVAVQVTDGIVPFRLELYRQCAKVNFTINAPLADAINGFRLKGYRLCNVPLSGFLHDIYKNESINNAYDVPNGTYSNFPAVNITGDSTIVHFTYYMNENHMGKVTSNPASSSAERTAVHAPANATYLEVYVADMSGKQGTYRYYLGNLITDINASEFNYYNILRGYDYYVTINLNDIDENDGRLDIIKVGDFLCSDGSVISPEKLATSGKTPIAIVFSTKTSATDKAHGWNYYAMALKNVHSSGSTVGNYKWANSDGDVSGIPNTSNSTWQTRSSDMDGYTNTTYLNSTDYPAGYAAKTTYASQVTAPSNTSGWFLPSSGQWYWILVNLGGMSATPGNSCGWINMSSTAASNLNSKLSKVGSGNYDAFGDDFELYWGSSERGSSNAYGALFVGDMYFADNFNMSDAYRVRAVIAF